MALGSISGINSPVTVTEIPEQKPQLVREVSKKDVEKLMSTEQYIRQYFSDIPIMIEIAKCESTFRHLDSKGEVHRGKVNNADVGVMQINEYYHLETAEKENYNIYSIEGNTAYARKLYEKQGTQPWISSKACWGKHESALAMNK